MPLGAWLRAFALTCAIELPVVLLLTRELGIDVRRRALLALFAQLATHPLVWHVFPYIPGLTGWQAFVASELYAWMAEAILYATAWPTLRLSRALAISAVANGLSLSIGLAPPIARLL
ncbi:MAG: hypothetical protein ACHREM_28950 [Polyangiales bacterium]